ncbi:unnamed protein product [Brassicogethes aeneus]|uniref:Uncharacterized protein n=1 Tax=Brassicogethes aeneus TaxID=1431903 RepID=A0A9P0BJ08_BRAAE|nr:unnamed protein product [Brassicogethes aeneus]
MIQDRQSAQKNQKMKRKATEKEDPRIEEAFKILQQPIQEDSSTLYAKYLADQLNKLNPKTIVIHKINNIIFEATIETYGTIPSTPSLISSLFASPTNTSLSSPASPPPISIEVLDTSNVITEVPQIHASANENSQLTENVIEDLQEFVYMVQP